MNQLEPKNDKPPASIGRTMNDTVNQLWNAMERTPSGGFSISDQRLPDGDVRSGLSARASELATSLTPADPRDIAQEIAAMFIRFPNSKADRAEIAAYVADLRKFPMWAIRAAILDCMSSASAFPPSAPQVAGAAKDRVLPFDAERGKIDAILAADVYHVPSDDERKRVNQKFAELIAELKLSAPFEQKKSPTWRPPTKSEAEEWLKRESEKEPPAIKLSEAARRTVTLYEPEKAQDGESKHSMYREQLAK